eukprot:5155103-Alexandrium_andersonii.AAC.1
MGVYHFRSFRAAHRPVWPVGRAGTGCILGPELSLTGGVNDRVGAGAYDNWRLRLAPEAPIGGVRGG